MLLPPVYLLRFLLFDLLYTGDGLLVSARSKFCGKMKCYVSRHRRG